MSNKAEFDILGNEPGCVRDRNHWCHQKECHLERHWIHGHDIAKCLAQNTGQREQFKKWTA